MEKGRKPRLTLAMKLKRLQFAKKYKDWTNQQWSRILFSDETTIQQFASRKRTVRRTPGTRCNETFTQQTMKHTPSVMIWGAISTQGTAGLFFLDPGTAMNGKKYLELMNEKLELHMAVHNCEIFMHDGAPCSGVQRSGDARGDCFIGCPLLNSSIKQWRMVVLLLDIRCLWRHNMTSNSCLQINVLAKFADTTWIFRDAGAAVGQGEQ